MSELTIKLIIASVFSCLLSAAGVGVLYRFLLKQGIMDIPNDRSSHTIPTPRGGGMASAIAAMGVGAVCYLGWGSFIPAPTVSFALFPVLIWGGLVISILGWLDDCYSLPVAVRFGTHWVLGLCAAIWLRPGATWGEILFFNLAVSWAINFFNFMDGIDGFAGSEAVIAGLIGGGICLANGLPEAAFAGFIVAGSFLGFLFWNWPPAKIFMGDCGSGFLGYYFGCLAICSGWGFKGGFGMWMVLLLVFWGDATLTLFRRMLRKEKFWEAHRSHFYQQAVQAGFSHLAVLRVSIVFNLLLGGVACYLAGVFS